MRWGDYWKPYVPVAKRRANAARELARRQKKGGQAASPVVIAGRQIATSFWGKAWCDNLESYSDFSNRLPRGRTYVRNGSVVDLKLAEGRITALVSGSDLYEIDIKIKALPVPAWQRLKAACVGKIDSLIEMLQGRLSAGVMAVVSQRGEGLFPRPAELSMKCSCPDSASLCKHLAAVLYGIGARLDRQPELLFQLRAVDPADLISVGATAEAIRETTGGAGKPAIAETDLADVFGIEFETAPVVPPAVRTRAKAKRPAPRKPARPAAKKRKVTRRRLPAT